MPLWHFVNWYEIKATKKLRNRLFPYAVVLLTLVIAVRLWENVNPGLLCATAQAGEQHSGCPGLCKTGWWYFFCLLGTWATNADASEKYGFQVTRAQHIGKPSSFDILLRSFFILVALCLILSSMSMLLMYWGTQNWTQCFSWGLTSVD